MIYSYGFKNYFGFKEGADVSFLLGSRVPQEISGGRKAATILGVKGANGAGKTNLLKALTFISTFCNFGPNSKAVCVKKREPLRIFSGLSFLPE